MASAKPLKIGDHVQINGLISRADLNGSVGEITSPLSGDGRYDVLLRWQDDKGVITEATFAISPEKLSLYKIPNVGETATHNPLLGTSATGTRAGASASGSVSVVSPLAAAAAAAPVSASKSSAPKAGSAASAFNPLAAALSRSSASGPRKGGRRRRSTKRNKRTRKTKRRS